MKIEKNIPQPKRGTSAKYPFALLEVGDSFLSPNGSVRSAACIYAKRHPGVKFVCRAEGKGVRTWRTA